MPDPPAAVAGGNVETSQRIVDVVLGALAQACPERVPAASQGTMNNVTVGGWDADRQQPFAYYETIGGGMGARPTMNGASAIHSHMTNTMNTPSGSAGICLSIPSRAICSPTSIRWGWTISWWRWNLSRSGVSLPSGGDDLV